MSSDVAKEFISMEGERHLELGPHVHDLLGDEVQEGVAVLEVSRLFA